MPQRRRESLVQLIEVVREMHDLSRRAEDASARLVAAIGDVLEVMTARSELANRGLRLAQLLADEEATPRRDEKSA